LRYRDIVNTKIIWTHAARTLRPVKQRSDTAAECS
jgi:hypothetical protein